MIPQIRTIIIYCWTLHHAVCCYRTLAPLDCLEMGMMVSGHEKIPTLSRLVEARINEAMVETLILACLSKEAIR